MRWCCSRPLSGSGKTTLTAALVRAGWAYGTDEAVGVRAGSLAAVTYPKPLVLDLDEPGRSWGCRRPAP